MPLHTFTDATTLFTTLDAARWDGLVARSNANTPFASWAWASAWWAAYQPGQVWAHALTGDDGTLLALAPWFVGTLDEQPTVQFIGSEDVSDYLDLIVDPAHADDAHSTFAQALIDAPGAFARVVLHNIPEASPTLGGFRIALEACGFTVAVHPRDVCPVITLPPTFDAYLEALDAKQRREVSRKLRRAEAGDDISFTQHTYGTPGSPLTDDALGTFLALMRASDPAKATFLENAQHVDFFQRMAARAAEEGWLRLHILAVDGTPAAAYLNFDDGQRIYVYNSGLDPAVGGTLGPGIVLLARTIQQAIETGHTHFDFMRGNEAYKYRMGGSDTHVMTLEATLPAAP